MPILQLDKVFKRFDAYYALHEVSFGLNEGEVLCFLGPSGCGKTTLLRIIAGLEAADSGEVRFAGQSLAGVPPHRRDFGMMFQEYALFPHMSVAENVAFGLKLRSLPADKVRARVEEMLGLVGLAGFGSRRVGGLSGGERQRVALARSLAPQPKLLMLDEPLAALDRALRERLARDLRTILKSVGVTAIFVTHDQSEAFAIADQVAVFHDGRLEQYAPPEEVYTRPANETVARFLGFRNIFSGTLRPDGRLDTPLGLLAPDTAPKQAGEARLLLRPDSARLLPAGEEAGKQVVVRGTVRERTFLGHGVQLLVEAAPGLELRFLLPLDPPPPGIGEEAAVAVLPSALVVLGE